MLLLLFQMAHLCSQPMRMVFSLHMEILQVRMIQANHVRSYGLYNCSVCPPSITGPFNG